ncbi:FeMo cofactor biosynthesis protein NifB [Fundidesulfovibrio magnetotacticus]|uniref:FeMo cofactor biosynthesis protein NifB n=1 Tax=Fundidesulfovibrio magnetotacticus TaxID=2730080 RepID=A0A6V8M1J2_9BACT|nr:nitrogenase cofactor biosynthesis protein NifB [Fundidesulfovibrio magnetotacticus]GFK96079.1 FeMo cofactor biosynthesis protein NifB [Fundidesulfovibrio magnetotacticus]
MAMDLSKHPCFNKDAKGSCARVHLPVAPKCNIQCNYCNRKYDCVNESRPGVTSSVLTPHQAMLYMEKVMEAEKRVTVVGIAGPGDPMANARETLETMRLIKKRWPDMILCLSSNGLQLPEHVDELAEIGVSHVTVTVNAVDPEIAAKIYSWARIGKVLYRGEEAARILLERQKESIRLLKAKDIIVKVNTIVMPGINDHHVEEIARTMKEMGVNLLNCMALIPNKETKFELVPEPSKARIEEIRAMAEQYLPQMRHCQRCRADAVGLLEKDCSKEFSGLLASCAAAPAPVDASRPYVAVASMEGMLVNMHLGEAGLFQIWGEDEAGGYKLVENRPAPPTGGGPRRWYDLAKALKDCRAVLVSGVGDTPQAILEEEGVKVVAMSGFISQGLDAVFKTGDINKLRAKGGGGCKMGKCSGGGEGC